MPEKHPNTTRWGGPGASHEDASKPMPEPGPAHPPEAVSTNPRVSQVSGGGGERDEKHTHIDRMRSAKSHATDSPSPTTTREWRKNRSRRDREADREAMETAEEPRSFAGEESDAPESERQFLVQLNTDDHIPGTESVAGQVEENLRHALRRFSRRLTRVEVFVTDANASKSGPGDKRCSIEARPKGGDPVAASHTASTIDEAVAGAAGKLTRALETELGRKQNRKGAESIRGSVEDLP